MRRHLFSFLCRAQAAAYFDCDIFCRDVSFHFFAFYASLFSDYFLAMIFYFLFTLSARVDICRRY